MDKLVKRESGQALVIVAIFMGLIALGFLALAVDVGMLFREKRMAQVAADAAALAATEELSYGQASNEQTAANAVAKLNGFDTTLATYPATVTLSTPSTGNFVGSTYVKVVVSKPTHTVFLSAFSGIGATTVSATATAATSPSQTCVCLEGSSGQNLSISNGSRLNAPACGVVANSSSSNAVGVVGGSTLNAVSLGTVSSSWINSSNINNGGSITSTTKIVEGLSSGCSPTLPTAPFDPLCLGDPGGSYGTYTFGPLYSGGIVCYTGLTVGANGSTDTLNPGIYVISNGVLHFESGTNGHSNLGGNGVFFYLTGTASLAIDNGANVNLVAGGGTESDGTTAPTVSSYNGFVIVQDPGDSKAASLQGGSGTYINGALYAPSASLTIGNGSSATVTGGILAASLTVNGGGTLNVVAGANEGSSSSGSAKLVQ
jgi:Flp pilus assembly protein TadG